MLLSILIVNWNTRQVTLDCLQSLADARPSLAHEIILVDNASEDGSVQAIAERFPAVHLIANPDNRGFAAANNQAFHACQGELVLLLNSDTLVRSGQLEALVAHMQATPGVGIAGPRLLNPDGSDQLSALRFIEPWDVFFEYARFPALFQPRAQRSPRRLHELAASDPSPVDYVLGAALLIRRSVIATIGLLDEEYFMYGEEVDWCYRAKQAGWGVSFLPTAQITHLGGQSTARIPRRMLAQRFTSSLRFLAKHRGAGAARLTRVLLAWAACQNALLYSARRLAGKTDRQTHAHELASSWVVLRTAIANRIPANLD